VPIDLLCGLRADIPAMRGLWRWRARMWPRISDAELRDIIQHVNAYCDASPDAETAQPSAKGRAA
jgi:hypothetical protein